MEYAGVIFLGGKSVRLGGIDKAGLLIGKRTCLDWVFDNLARNIDTIAISLAHGGTSDLRPNLPRIKDVPSPKGNGGVAFAILACLQWARDKNLDFIVTTPVDTPFLPHNFTQDLIANYKAANQETPIAVSSDGRLHGLHALWPTQCLENLTDLVMFDNIYKIQRLHSALGSTLCHFEIGAYDPFININTPKDIEKACDILA